MSWYDDMRGGPDWVQECKNCGKTTNDCDFADDLCDPCHSEEIGCPSCGDIMALGELYRYGKCHKCRMTIDEVFKHGLLMEAI